MITQAIKRWLQKLFAWWPWKQSTPMEYQHVASVVTRGPLPEAAPWPRRESMAPQSEAASCLSTLEEQPETTAQPRLEALAQSPFPASAFFLNKDKEQTKDTEQAVDAGDMPSIVPAHQQRLEFLRYLVQRGIVNEGFEKKETDG